MQASRFKMGSSFLFRAGTNAPRAACFPQRKMVSIFHDGAVSKKNIPPVDVCLSVCLCPENLLMQMENFDRSELMPGLNYVDLFWSYPPIIECGIPTFINQLLVDVHVPQSRYLLVKAPIDTMTS